MASAAPLNTGSHSIKKIAKSLCNVFFMFF